MVHRPTLREEVQIGVLFAQLRTPTGTTGTPRPGPVDLDDDREGLAYMIAALNVVTDVRPECCPKDFGELRDSQLLIDLFACYREWGDSFRRRVQGESEGGSGAS